MHPFTFSNTVLSNTECVLLAIVMVSIIALTTNIVLKTTGTSLLVLSHLSPTCLGIFWELGGFGRDHKVPDGGGPSL